PKIGCEPELETLDYEPVVSKYYDDYGMTKKDKLNEPKQPMTKKEAEQCAREYFKTSEQPKTIIKTIQQRMHVITNELEELGKGITNQVAGDSVRKVRVLQALEKIADFEKTTLYELQKAFE
ncbi:unnamed protein product, partial [marine sediment metagenome]